MTAKSSSIRDLPLQRLLPVRSIADLAYLVKESEIVTGTPGREFVIMVADRPAYQVATDLAGFQIERLGAHAHKALATPLELPSHAIGSALACGQLFTAPLAP